MNTSNMNTSNTIEQFRSQVKDNFDNLLSEYIQDTRPSLYFNGINSSGTITDDDNLSFTSGTADRPVSFVCKVKNLKARSQTQRLLAKGTTGQFEYEFTVSSANTISLFLYSLDGAKYIRSATNTPIPDNFTGTITATYDGNATDIKIYFNGILQDYNFLNNASYTNMQNGTGVFYIGNRAGASYVLAEICDIYVYNCELSAAEVLANHYDSIAYYHKNASNTDLTAGNGSFATDTTGWWTAVNGAIAWNSGTQDSTITSNGAGATQLSKTSFFTSRQGKRIRVTFKAKSPTLTAQIDGVSAGGSVFTALSNPSLSANYQNYVFEGVVGTTHSDMFIRFGTFANGSQIIVDDIVVQQIGCVLDLMSKNANSIKFSDASGNNMYADLSNVEIINQGMSHESNLPYKNITGNSTVVIPKGYLIDQIYIKNTTANAITGGIKLGTTAGGTNVISAFAVAGNLNGVISDATLLKKFFSDTDNTTLYLQAVTAWNSASINVVIGIRRIA